MKRAADAMRADAARRRASTDRAREDAGRRQERAEQYVAASGSLRKEPE
jgi:hypothetical protein